LVASEQDAEPENQRKSSGLAVPARIRSIAGSGKNQGGPVTGPAGDVTISQPFGVELDSLDPKQLYICSVGDHRIVRLDQETGVVHRVAGDGELGNAGDGGPATAARLNEPYEIRFDDKGNLFFVDMKAAVVRRIDRTSGKIETIAGTGKQGFSGDGRPAILAQLQQPHSIALDGRGGLYIADIGNHRIRRVDLESGQIESVAGNGKPVLPTSGAAARGAPILGPRALHIPAGSPWMWIALREGHSVWKLHFKTGALHHVAGTGKQGHDDGAALKATFNGPKGIFAAPDDGVFVVDTENQVIRKIDTRTSVVTTVAGSGPAGRGFGGDNGPATAALLDRPHGITVGLDGTIYIGDTNNHRVRTVR
jgi:streptogramin lyase